MAGFEIAGVVLGSIPLVISALEHYKQGISTIRTWRNYERELRSLIRNLKTEQARFQDACEKLLVGIASPSLIESMVEDPFGPAWQEEEIQVKIKARLWRSFAVFEDIMDDMNDAVKMMKQRLDLEPDGEVKWKEASFIIREFKRASFVLKRSDHAEQIATIKDGITNLESLIDRNIKMEPERRLWSQGRLMRLVREVSRGVYHALRSNFQCSCSHEAHLDLASRTADISQGEADDEIIQKLSFQLALTYRKSTSNGHSHDRVSREELRIQPLPQDRGQSSQQAGKLPRPRKSGNGKKKNVGFALPHHSTGNTAAPVGQTPTVVVQMAALNIKDSKTKPSNHINLCESICQGQKKLAVDCYGMIIDSTAQNFQKFGVYPMTSSDGDEWSIVSLREVLEQPLVFPHMSVSAKLHLAVIISSSFLQLHQTPWLPDIITTRDILFLKRGAEIRYDQVFVMKRLSDDPNSDQNCKNSAPNSRSPALLALGILLLELNLGGTIDSLRTQNETRPAGATSLMYDSMAAHRLLQQRQLGSLNYSSAVQRCIWGEFARPTLDLNDEDFRQEIYEKVVALLETDLENATWTFDAVA